MTLKSDTQKAINGIPRHLSAVVRAVVVLCAVLASGPANASSQQTASQSREATKSPCGKGPTGSLGEARRLLAANDAGADHLATLCLLEAVETIKSESAIVERGSAKALSVPSYNREPNKQ